MDGQFANGFATTNAVRVCGAAAGLERRLALLATMQHDVGTRAQLLSLGFTREAIDSRVKSGRFRALYRGVYLIGPVELPFTALSAAHLVCGAGAALSHRTATRLHGFIRGEAERRPVDVAVARPRHPTTRPGITLRSVGPWRARELMMIDRLPVTAPLRTILDFASTAGRGELEQAVATALRRRAFTRAALVDAANRRANRRGMPSLIAILTGPGRPAFARSRAERMLVELIRAAKLPQPDSNVPIGDRTRERYEADLLWREQGLIVEFDSVEHHSDEHAFQADRARDAYLLTLGYRVMRVTWEQLVDEPTVVVARIAGALAARPAAA